MIINDIKKILTGYFAKYNDDPVDRLHYLHTVVVLSVYLLFVTSKSYYGEPIQCVANNIGESVKYIHSMCWINGTFHSTERDPTDITYDEVDDKMDYYQWMVFIILAECVICSFPSMIWSLVVYLNGFDLVHVTKNIMPKLYEKEYDDDWSNTRKVIENITDHLKLSLIKPKVIANNLEILSDMTPINDYENRKNSLLLDNKCYNNRRTFPNLKTKSTFPLYFPYLLIKLFYLMSIICHFLYLSYMFNFNYFIYGIHGILLKYFVGNYEIDREYFPKKGFCFVKFYSKKYFNEAGYVCALPINLFNQIFYLGLWYWLIIIGLITIGSVGYWLTFLGKTKRRQFVLKCLQLNKYNSLIRSYTAAYYLDSDLTSFELADRFFIEKTGMTLMKNFDLFFKDVCTLDLVFLIKIIELNSNKLASRDIFNSLWDEYLDLDVKAKSKNDLNKRSTFHLKRTHKYYADADDSIKLNNTINQKENIPNNKEDHN